MSDIVTFWSAPAERSGDGALDRLGRSMCTELKPIIQSAVVAGALQIFLLLYDVRQVNGSLFRFALDLDRCLERFFVD